MRKFIILSLFLGLFFSQTQILKAQTFWKHANHLKGTNINNLTCSVKDASDNTYLLGTFQDTIIQGDSMYTSKGGTDIFIAKYDNTSNMVWVKTIGSTGNEFPGGISLSTDEQTVYVGGGYRNTCFFNTTDSLVSVSGVDAFISRYSATTGDIIWAKTTAKGTSTQRIDGLSIDNNDNIIVSGLFRDQSEFSNDTLTQALWNNYIAKYDANGNFLWSKLIKTGGLSVINNVRSTPSSLYFSGYFTTSITFDTDTFTSIGSNDFVIYKTNTAGIGLWARSAIGAGRDIVKAINVDNDTLYAVGEYESGGFLIDSLRNIQNTNPITNKGSRDIILMKYDPSGKLLWFKIKNYLYDEFVNSVSKINGYLYISGSYTDQLTFNNDTLITQGSTDSNPFYAKYDINGKEIGGVSLQTLGGSSDVGIDVKLDANEFMYVNGDFGASSIVIGDSTFSQNVPGVSQDIYIAKGCPIIGINELSMTSVLCAGDSTGALSIQAIGGQEPYNYMWSNDSTNTTISNLPAGAYTVTVSYASSQCNKTQTFYVTESALMVVDSIANSDVTVCNPANGAITVYAKGRNNMSYSIDNGSTYQNDSTFSGLIAGEYQFVIKDTNNCQIVSSIDTVKQTLVTIQIDTVVTQNVTCYGVSNGSISIAVSGGNGTYEYSVDGGATYQKDSQFVALSSNDYLIAVKDSVTACELLGNTKTVSQPDSIKITEQTKNNVLCYGLSTGSVIIKSSGGTNPISYKLYEGTDSISTNATGVFITLAAGNYLASVSDANNCTPTISDTLKLTQPAQVLGATYTVTNTSAIGANDGSIAISASGGTNPYNYNLDSGSWQTSSDFTGVAAGTYSVFVRDTNLCGPIEITSIQVSDPNAINDNEKTTFNIYPNPSLNGQFVVEFSMQNNTNLIEIVSLSGQKVFEQNITGNKADIDLSSSASGLYLIKINGLFQAEKLIIK